MKTWGTALCAAFALAIAFTPIAAMAQDADLILYYDYEAFAGDEAVDMSGKGRVGVINGEIKIEADAT
ncbi:hypothetical protein HN937_17580, partial [Candidatus Poribacteria bacterium]|nr:hypothetical protein [Candidatus Poribacteria bacterium]